MKKLCLGTFLHIISQARGASVKQKNLVGALLRCVDCSEASFYADDDMRQGHLKNGRDNIPSYFADAVRAGNPDSIFSYFADVIHPMLDKSKERHVVLAFRNVLEEDTDIADTINLGPVSGYTKSDILTKNRFSYIGLLTNLFIHCVTQVENKPYQANIKEIDKAFVDSFADRVDTVFIDEKILTIPTPLDETAKRKSFDDVFTEVKHPHTLSIVNPSQVRIYHLNVGDYAFDFAMLSKFIKDNLGRYVFSRAKRNEYTINEDIESIALDAATSLKNRGTDPTDAHFAEIMLYSFLECALGAPKIMSKIELQNIGGEYRSKSSGIHLLSMPGTTSTIHQLVFGSTDVLADLHGAVDSAFAQIVEIKNSASDEHTLVDANIMNGSFNPEVTAFLKETIIPQKNKPKRPDTAFGVFLGYNVNVPNADSIPSDEYIPALMKKMQADITACIPYIQNKIDTLGLSRHSFYIYVLPLDDISRDRANIMKKALGV